MTHEEIHKLVNVEIAHRIDGSLDEVVTFCERLYRQGVTDGKAIGAAVGREQK